MEKEELKQICVRLIGQSPVKLVNKANSYLVQSKPTITLKPGQSHARPYVCCALAIEELKEILDLDNPDLSKPPLPAREYKKVYNEFRNNLVPKEYGQEQASQSEDEDEEEYVKQTPKRAKRAPEKDDYEESASHVAFRKRKKTAGEPHEQDMFVALHSALDLSLQALEAMVTAHKEHVQNVTDRWGLAMAIAFVVIYRSSPEKSVGLERAIVSNSRIKDARDRMNKWMPFAERLLNGQRKLASIAIVPEEQEVRDCAGAWTFRLEPPNWWNDHK